MSTLPALFPAPAFVGLPGGMELLVILLLAVCVFGIPTLLLLGGGGYLFARSSRRDERLKELEREVDTLRERVDESDGSSEDGRDGEEDRDATPTRKDDR
ncbi:hypothetical protein [Halarchaeum salinum]|uniref:Preprotein translocase subunit TatA n=1 Tax=Halarchaeum salinum TaxID=489912 RepID=A0AAV3S4S3_9EURY